MVFITQDGLKAIAPEEIQFYFIKTGSELNTLMAKPKNCDPSSPYQVLKMFEDENLETVKKVMLFLTCFEYFYLHKPFVKITVEELNKIGLNQI